MRRGKVMRNEILPSRIKRVLKLSLSQNYAIREVIRANLKATPADQLVAATCLRPNILRVKCLKGRMDLKMRSARGAQRSRRWVFKALCRLHIIRLFVEVFSSLRGITVDDTYSLRPLRMVLMLPPPSAEHVDDVSVAGTFAFGCKTH